MTAYYNEIDPYAAQWLRNLIARGAIAPGDVDERSIEDIKPYELRKYTQCHFFAGIGVWSYALRVAGWQDDWNIWTGSCPCQPFSTAGKGNGFADERHLWPAFFHLISECQPQRVLGEQVASKDGLGWIDLVRSDLEAEGYACSAVDLCSAGVGAPHIRQRLYWVADAMHAGRSERWAGSGDRSAAGRGSFSSMADADDARLEGRNVGSVGFERSPVERGGSAGWLADADRQRRIAQHSCLWKEQGNHTEVARGGPTLKLVGQVAGKVCGEDESVDRTARPGPTNGFWRDADWLGCRDGKWRPVEPGTFPLAHGAPGRVGRLRAYGNAVNAQVTRIFIEAYCEARGIDLSESL